MPQNHVHLWLDQEHLLQCYNLGYKTKNKQTKNTKKKQREKTKNKTKKNKQTTTKPRKERIYTRLMGGKIK